MIREIDELCKYSQKIYSRDVFLDICDKTCDKKKKIREYSYVIEDIQIGDKKAKDKLDNATNDIIEAIKYINDLADKLGKEKIFHLKNESCEELYNVSIKFRKETSIYNIDFLTKLNQNGFINKVERLRKEGKLDILKEIESEEEKNDYILKMINSINQ